MKASMYRFTAIDGLRAWLAWIVVIGHVVMEAGLRDGGLVWHAVFNSGNWAVRTFIVISGFVITHLLLEKREAYRAYVVRRFMRLYPCFIVCCLLGGLAYWYAAHMGDNTWFLNINAEQYKAQTDHLWANVLAHVFMIHGAIPNDLLPGSEYAFLNPGWSVSLEWQFYLLAPVLIPFFKSRKNVVVIAVFVFAVTFFYRHWLYSHWYQPSMILGQAQYFFLGIFSRFAAMRIYGKFQFPVLLSQILGFVLIYFGLITLGIWVIAFFYMTHERKHLIHIERAYFLFMDVVLDSQLVQYLAKRSYSTYLLHFPVLLVLGAVTTHHLSLSKAGLANVLMLALPITLILQEPLYRWVEIPGQAYGKRWARALGAFPVIEVPMERT